MRKEDINNCKDVLLLTEITSYYYRDVKKNINITIAKITRKDIPRELPECDMIVMG